MSLQKKKIYIYIYNVMNKYIIILVIIILLNILFIMYYFNL